MSYKSPWVAAVKAAREKPPEPDPRPHDADYGGSCSTAACRHCGRTARIPSLCKLVDGSYECPPRSKCDNEQRKQRRRQRRKEAP